MCEPIQLPGGGRRSHRQPPMCAFCARTSVAVCDFVVRSTTEMTSPLSRIPDATCDLPMCWEHCTSIGHNRDYCPNHAKHAPQRKLSSQKGNNP